MPFPKRLARNYGRLCSHRHRWPKFTRVGVRDNAGFTQDRQWHKAHHESLKHEHFDPSLSLQEGFQTEEHSLAVATVPKPT